MPCFPRVPTWRIIKELQEERGCNLIDPAELSNVELDRLIAEGKKILIVEVKTNG